jgi:hypothetical protein
MDWYRRNEPSIMTAGVVSFIGAWLVAVILAGQSCSTDNARYDLVKHCIHKHPIAECTKAFGEP